MTATILEVSTETYHELESVSNSGLNVFLTEGPATYKAKYIDQTIEDKPSTDLVMGSQLHALLLESKSLVVIPEEVLSESGRRQGKAWKQFCDEHADAKWMLKPDEAETLQAMANAIHECPLAVKCLLSKERIAERALSWIDEETGLELRCRPDVFQPELGLLVDLKTTSSTNSRAFARCVVDFGYHRQVAFYREGMRQFIGAPLPFVFVVVNKQPPHEVEVIELSGPFEAAGHDEMRKGLRALAKCYETNNWRSPTWNNVVTIEHPFSKTFQQ